jgi:hypothetical protein
MVIDLHQMSEGMNCQNCGWGSHCGTAKYVQTKDYACDGGEYREIKICHACRCELCTKESAVRENA